MVLIAPSTVTAMHGSRVNGVFNAYVMAMMKCNLRQSPGFDSGAGEVNVQLVDYIIWSGVKWKCAKASTRVDLGGH